MSSDNRAQTVYKSVSGWAVLFELGFNYDPSNIREVICAWGKEHDIILRPNYRAVFMENREEAMMLFLAFR